ncbi:Lipase [Madurella mycetomatis]|uniref:Lipase n=1 Tax=Madurella mycetomatis TaxID=100816 RepID=A0A175VTG9_9PEZI|nr:Lipase [Madurella mycetomatis]KXX74817.1 Lipase [Madurella mycetomatis]
MHSQGAALAAFLGCLAVGSAHVIPAGPPGPSQATTQHSKPRTGLTTLVRRDDDPTDFSWIKRFSAIGDSFTAGIGAGTPLGSFIHDRPDWKCSRYDRAYPVVVYDALGPAVEEFNFRACSGDRSVQIYDQVLDLPEDNNFVIMTAGGNDLCLAGMIKKCVFLPFDGETACQEIINKAQENIDTILRPNLKQILQALNNKMADDGIVVYNGYAKFFDTTDEKCANEQNWKFNKLNWWKIWPFYPSPFELTKEYREQFNNLVDGINEAIKAVVAEIAADSNIKYKIGFSDWDPWPREVEGQYCDPKSTGKYPDPEQPNLQFFKPNTQKGSSRDVHDGDSLKKRDLWNITDVEALELQERTRRELNERSIYDSLLYKSANPRAVALKKLDPRNPSPPNCPGDSDWGIDPPLGIGLPDSFGKNFHPNEAGHITIASFALETLVEQRAKVLGVDSPVCQIEDEFKCWKQEGRRKYARADLMDKNYKHFCNEFVKQPPNTKGWTAKNTYQKGTPEEHTFILQLGDVSEFNKASCLDSFARIIHGCDGNDPANPMNWKFGGRYVRGEYTYELNVERDRPWPIIFEPRGLCGALDNWILFFPVWSSYVIYGAGWATDDWGQETLLKECKACFGLGITLWRFDYFDKPDALGMEWKAEFNTPILVKDRCFNNQKIAHNAGGNWNSINNIKEPGCGWL